MDNKGIQLAEPLLSSMASQSQVVPSSEREEMVDFKEMLQEYRDRTEFNVPYTISQCEDGIFVGEHRLITLDYTFYQDDGRYSTINTQKPVSQQATCELLGNFKKDRESTFQNQPTELYDQNDDYMNESDNQFMETKKGSGAKVVGMISMWRVDQTGTLRKEKETSFQYAGMMTKSKSESREGKLKLQLSQDNRYVFLPLIFFRPNKDKSDKLNFAQIVAWSSNSLKPMHANSKLYRTLSGELPFVSKVGKLTMMSLVGNSKFLKLEFNQESQGRNYQFYQLETGNLVYECNNLQLSKEIVDYQNVNEGGQSIQRKKTVSETEESSLCCIDLVAEDRIPSHQSVVYYIEDESLRPQNAQLEQTEDEKYAFANVSKVKCSSAFTKQGYVQEARKWSNDLDSIYAKIIVTNEHVSFQQGNSKLIGVCQQQALHDKLLYDINDIDDHAHEVDKDSSDPTHQNLDLIFVYASDFKLKDNKWKLVNFRTSLKEIQLQSKDKTNQDNWIKSSAIQEIIQKLSTNTEILIPQKWFIDDHGNAQKTWATQIEVRMNKSYTQIGLLNQSQNLYLAFNYKDGTEIVTQKLLAKAISSHGRNQMCKELLQVVMRIQGRGTTTIVYFDTNMQKNIKFGRDHNSAIQDTIVLNLPVHDENAEISEEMKGEFYEQSILQSVTQAINDQTVFLITEDPKKIGKVTSDQVDPYSGYISRNEPQQKQMGSFPVIMYNIGLSTLVIQLLSGQRKSLMYKLPKDENFINFVHLNTLDDLGFKVGSLRIEACSRFAYLTRDRQSQYTYMNLMLIDPYYDNTQILQFRSSSFVQEELKLRNSDAIWTSLVYNSGTEVKLIQQYTSFFEEQTFTDKPVEKVDEEAELSNHNEKKSKVKLAKKKAETDELEKVNMVMGANGRIYYVTSYDAEVLIKEIQPGNDQDHRCVFKIKAETCFGFAQRGQFFYLQCGEEAFCQLKLNVETSVFEVVKELKIKDKDIPNFQSRPYNSLIMEEEYAIVDSKIFYLYSDRQFDAGILDMEELSEGVEHEMKDDVKMFINGPYRITGSDLFSVIYNYNDSLCFKQRVYQRPNSSRVTLMSDLQNKVKLATFLDKQSIMVQIDYRYMIFTQNGIFIDDVEFDDLRKQRIAKIKLDNQMAKPNDELGGRKKGEDEMHAEEKDQEQDVMPEGERMKLQVMSDSNRYFLFEDRLKKEWRVYHLSDKGYEAGDLMKHHNYQNGDHKHDYVMTDQYTLQFNQCDLIKGTSKDEGWHEEALSLLKQKVIDVKIDNQGGVTLTYCQEQASRSSQEDSIEIKVTILKNKAQATCVKLQQSVLFKSNAKEDIFEIIKIEEDQLNNFIKIEQGSQMRLPNSFRDDTYTKELKGQLKNLIKRKNSVVSAETFGNIILVICGRYIQYGHIEDTKGSLRIKDDFIHARINFSSSIEVYNIRSTASPDLIQIIAKDAQENILIMLTWDFLKNVEVSIWQEKYEKGEFPQNYIVKGLDEKMNYFTSKHQIYDLEYNMPIQKTVVSSFSKPKRSQFNKQRKIYSDESRYLSVDDQNILVYPVTRIELLFWAGLIANGASPQSIKDNASLSRLGHVFCNGITMFHYFADNVDVISQMINMYQQSKDAGTMTRENLNMPLILLHPDSTGRTALEWSIKKQTMQAFVSMVDFLEPFDNVCVSSMIIDLMPDMISNTSPQILKFFETSMFQPVLIEEAVMVRWPDDADNFIFASCTSLITVQSIEEELMNQGLIDKIKDEEDEKDDLLPIRSGIGSRSLRVDPDKDIGNPTKRVTISALDFNWIFENDNAKSLIKILADYGSGDLFVTKSFRTLIDFLWQQYQPRIIKFIFFPYMIYMLMFAYVASNSMGDFLDLVDSGDYKNFKDDYAKQKNWQKWILYIVTLLYSFFTTIELTQFLQSYGDYFKDYWNCIDFASICISGYNLWLIHYIILYDQLPIDMGYVRAIGALAVFFLWIKVFYWMRLFASSAYFITLIANTIFDIRVFTVVVLLVIMAFANFFYVINLNTPGGNGNMKGNWEEDFYIDDRIKGQGHQSSTATCGSGIANALLAMYLLSLGEFSFDGFSKGENSNLVWAFFTLATFLCCVVFMNMLIAIMGETFGQLQTNLEQSARSEQVALLNDFVWLLNIQKMYEYQKYIVIIEPDEGTLTQELTISDRFDLFYISITDKIDKMGKNMRSRVDTMEKNTRSRLQYHKQKISTVKGLVTQLTKDYADSQSNIQV